MDRIATKHKFKLTHLLTKHGLSKRKLSRIAGISPALLTMMIQGKRTFQFRHRDNIATILGVAEESIVWNE